MLREFKLPDLGEGLTESEIVTWRVAAGDRVELNQIIADVETAKAVVELPSPVEGVVQALHAEEGQTVDVGAVIVTFDVGGDATPAPVVEEPRVEERAEGPRLETPPEPDEPADAPEPNLVGYGAGPDRKGHPVRRARIAAHHGAHLLVPAEPAVPTAPAPAAVPAVPAAAPSAPATPAPPAAPAMATAPAAPAPAMPAAPVTPPERPRSTPPVRHLAEQLGVDLTTVRGTGPDGLITREDVQAAVATTEEPHEQVHSEVERAPDPSLRQADTALERRIPIKGVRKFTAAAMVKSAFTAPHATCFLTVDVTPTLELLERLAERRDLAGTRVTLLALIARAFVIALRAHPELNSRWDEAAQEIVQFGYVNLGIAAATERGLVVPNIRDAHSMSLLDLADALTDLTQEARAGKTPPERMSGGTITISNLGVFGVDAGTPILNPGEAAILALGAAQNRPWEFHGELALRRVMTLSLSFDHRLVDGEQAARFLADLGGLLGDPALAMLRDGGTGPLPLG
jgi:pyruvate dehydrogenase E2 component (dihydrolipoamide acetyltransferase)